MIQFVKFLALTIGLAFSGTDAQEPKSTLLNPGQEFELDIQQETENTIAVRDTLKKDLIDISKVSQIPLQPSDHHACGMGHAHEVMRSMDPDYDKKLEHFKNVTLPELQEKGKEQRARRQQMMTLNMPIVFHIIHRPGEAVGVGQNLTDQTIIDQLETLNEDLAALNAGWPNVPARWEAIKGNPEMQFCLAEVDPAGAPTTGIVRHEYANIPNRDYIRNTIKPETHWDTEDYYNVWILSIPGTSSNGGVLGWAFFPSAHGRDFDGTVQDYRFTGKGGKTLTHEVGHSFGLPHTWGSGGCGADDGIADTPLQEANTNSIQRMSCNGTTWPTGPTTCGNEHMYINYMDYSPDACALTFTIGQGDAMRGIANGTRASLLTNAPIVAASCSAGTPTGGGGNPGGGNTSTIDYDAGIQTIFSPASGEFCSSGEVTPVVLLTNAFGDVPLTSCEIRYKISGTPGSTLFNWTGNLAKGETEEVTLQQFTAPDFSFEFTSWTDNPNGEDDENGFNDEKAVSLVVPDVFDPNVFEDFEDETDLPTSTMIEAIDPGTTFREWEISTSSAYGVGEVSAVFRNFDDPDGDGKEDILEFPLYNFEDIENPRIAFDIAYYDTNVLDNKDSLLIRVSTDCGATFTTVYKEGGASLATVSQQQQAPFTPNPNEWKNVVVDLFDFNGVFDFVGAEKVLIEFVNIGYGNNNLYLDNINLSDGCASNVQVQTGDLTCPDDCDGFINLLLNGFISPPTITWSNNVNGQTGESLDGLCAGNYSVTVFDSEFDCEFIQEIEISSPQEITLILTGTNISSPGADNGSAQAIVEGGTSFFTFEWSNSASNESFLLGLTPGEYCVTATDQAGCSISDCYEVAGFDCDMDVELVIMQPECGQDQGFAELIVTGANNPQFVWLDGIMPFSTGAQAGAIGPGSYIVNVTDQGIEDCTETFQFFIYDTNAPIVNADILNESSTGQNDGSITLNLSDDEDFTYTWSTGTSTDTELTDLGEGTYMVTLTNVFTGCESIETYNLINLNCTIEVAQTITNVSCFGESDGVVGLSASGGVSPYSYQWPTGPSFPFRNNLEAGITAVTVVDDDDCRTVIDVIVTQPAMLTAILTTTDESNPGAFDGSVSAQIFGGTMPYNISWSTGPADDGLTMINNLGGGLYFITVTDENGCSTISGASVEGKMCPDIVADASSSNVSCFDEQDGTLSVTVTGGLEPYTYLWSPGDYDQANVSDVPPGDYEVTVLDAEGCPASAEVSITQPAEFTVTLVGIDESSIGAGDGSITSTVSGGVGTLTYLWSGPQSFSANIANISLLVPAEYCVTVTDETNCIASACFTIGAGADPCEQFTANNASLLASTPISCPGAEDGTVTAVLNAGTPPYNYIWSNSDTEETATNVAAGLISVTITDANDCDIIISDFVVEEPEPIDIQANVTGLSFPGANDGSVLVTSTNGTIGTTTCSWTGPNGFTSDSCAGIMNLEPGIYILTVVDENDCEFTETYTVTGEADPCFDIELEASFVITNESIIGANDGALEAMVIGNASPIISYEWEDQNTNTYTGNPISDLAPGLYTLVVTTEAGCMEAFSVEVAAGTDPCLNFELVDFITMNNSCVGGADGQATVLVEGGLAPYTYSWSDLTSNTETATMLPFGMVAVTVTDANGCDIEGEILITEPEIALSLSASAINESIPGANNGSASANLIGGDMPYFYSWSGPNGFTASTMTIQNLEPGEYCVTGTDGNGCILEACTTVSAANDPCANLEGEVLITGISELTCVNSQVELSYESNFGEGPYTVEWFSANNPSAQITETILVDEAGLVTIIVTDVNGCIAEASYTIVENFIQPQYTLTITDPSSDTSEDGSALLTNVTPGATSVGWFDEESMLIGEELTIDDLAPGTYTVVLTNTENGCSSMETFVLIAQMADCASFAINVELEDITCAGSANGLAQIDVSNGTGPFTYDWEPALTDSPIQSSLPPGSYAVTVTDANGCTDDLSFSLVDPDVLSVSILISAVSAPGANDGSMTAMVEGGTPDYSYIWSNNEQGETISNLSEGDEFCVLIVDGNDCVAEACATIEFITEDCTDFEVELVFTNQISCFEANDGALQVNIINAVEPITYEWSDGLPNTQQQTDLGPGLYSVIVTDANNCTYDAQLELTEPESELNIDLTSMVVSSIGASDGTATVIATGGNEGLDYVYIWDDQNQQTTPIATDLSPGVYCVTVASGGCFAEDCIEVFDANDPCVDFDVSIDLTDATCSDLCDGRAVINIDGGLEPYQFNWSDGVTGLQERDDLCGLGSVTISDANDCTTVIEFLVNIPNQLEVVVSSTNATDLTSSDGSTSAAAFGGTSPYTYNWDNSTIGTLINNLEPDTYTVTVTDANGCTTEASVVVGVGEDACSGFEGSLEITNVSCFEGDDGSATVMTQGGFGTLLYDWSSSNTLGLNETGLAAGDFVVVVTDQNGCEIVLQGTIDQPEELVIDILDIEETSGMNTNDGSASIDVFGGTGDIVVTWSNGLGSDLVQDELAAGQYTVVVEDENGCTTTETIVIAQGSGGGNMEDCESLTASYAITPISCFNELDGAIEVFPAGGTAPYDISSSAQSFTGLQAGIIIITIEDANACVFEEEVLIPTPNPLTLNAQGFDGNCGLSASAEVIVSGGTPPFNVTWDNGDTGPFINGLETGDYGVIVVDANGCESESTVSVVKAFDPLTFDVTTTDASCDEDQDGRIILDITNLTDVSGVEFLWNDGVITQNRINLPGGTYTVTITDELGCEYILSREVLAPDPITATYNTESGSTNALFDVTVNATGGAGDYSYNWSDNSTGFFNDALPLGIYSVTITDANGCSSILEVEVDGSVAVLNNLDIITEFDLSPNPTTGAFFLDVTLTEVSDIQVTVFDILGQQILNNSYRGTVLNERLDLQDRAAGTYFVRIHNEHGQLTKKLIKVD